MHIYTNPRDLSSCKNTQMSETLADRIRQRLEALGKTANGASVEAGGSPSLIPNILNGRSENPRIDTLRKIATALDTTAEWLLGQSHGGASSEFIPAPGIILPDPNAMPKDLPVWGSAAGSLIDDKFEGFHIFGTAAVDYVRRPPALVGVRDAYGIYVTGDSMDPMHPHGALRMVHPHRPPNPGDSVVVMTRHWENDPGQGYIKLLRRRVADRLVLEQLNPPAKIEIPVKFIVSVHKVMDMNDLFGV